MTCRQVNRCFKMDLWQIVNDENLRSNHAQSHICCRASPEWVKVLQEKNLKTSLLLLCHTINLTMNTNLWVLFTFTYYLQVLWNNILENKQTEKQNCICLVHYTSIQGTKLHHSYSITRYFFNVSLPHYGLNCIVAQMMSVSFYCFLFMPSTTLRKR